jgi:hypothetical protein
MVSNNNLLQLVIFVYLADLNAQQEKKIILIR